MNAFAKLRGCAFGLAVALAVAGCGSTDTSHASQPPSGSSTAVSHPAGSESPATSTASAAPVPRESPPPSGPRTDVHFPAVARSTLRNGLEVNLVEYHELPIVQLQLVARAAGTSADPRGAPGLATFVGDMLKEGTRSHTSAQIADSIEFLGAQIAVTTSADATVLSLAVLRDHLDEALSLLAEIVIEPSFPQDEIDKLRRRELNRLTQDAEDPNWLSRQAFYRALYGTHPYAEVDTNPAALAQFVRADIAAFHRTRYVAGSMFVAVVGDLHAADFTPLAERTLGRIRRGNAPVIRFPSVPNITTRQVVLVDRPGSAQSVIRVGNTSLRRTAVDNWTQLAVANQVLGGDAASRLFMDLRERRSLTYGAYSAVTAAVDIGTFQAFGSVRTPVTIEALGAFFEHLDRIAHEAVPEAEMQSARNFLVDQFPLAVETPADVAALLTQLRLYGLPDNYWDSYRSRINAVTSAQAFAAAQTFIRPDRSLVVLVGDASQFQEALRHWGPVRVVNVSGRTIRELTAAP